MGYYLTLLLLQPRDHDFAISNSKSKNDPDRKCTLWETESILNIGRASAPAKHKSPRERAAFYFSYSMEPKLQEYTKSEGRKCFAAPFAILKARKVGTTPTYDHWEKHFVSDKDGPNCFIKPLIGASIYRQIPDQDTMMEHNKLHAVTDQYKPKSDIVFTRPLPWVDCKLLAEWINESEKLEYFRKRRTDDSEAMPYFDMWKSCIEEMGKVGSKALFYFEIAHFSSLI